MKANIKSKSLLYKYNFFLYKINLTVMTRISCFSRDSFFVILFCSYLCLSQYKPTSRGFRVSYCLLAFCWCSLIIPFYCSLYLGMLIILIKLNHKKFYNKIVTLFNKTTKLNIIWNKIYFFYQKNINTSISWLIFFA